MDDARTWWVRRQRSKESSEPYPVGRYREHWRQFPVLVRQYHPEFNDGISLSQIPPAADVLLQWQCDVGHRFVATPAEQQARPAIARRRSVWCPVCLDGALGRGPGGAPRPSRSGRVARTVPAGRTRGRAAARPSSARLTPDPAAVAGQRRAPRSAESLCARSTALTVRVGECFVSPCAPATASAAEARLRQLLDERLDLGLGRPGRPTAVRVAEPFFDHVEVWPDLILEPLRVVIEYDTVGRHGLEHVGPRSETDRRKDRVTRAAGWEVIRIRTAPLRALGPHDLEVGSLGPRTIDRLVDRLREVRGPLFVDAYVRSATPSS